MKNSIRPILLTHEKPITDIKYNRDGDLLFSACKAKDAPITVWWADNGERIGTYEGHQGAIYSIDVNEQSTKLISAAADRTVKMWDVESGKEICSFEHDVNLKACAFSLGSEKFLTVTDQIMNIHPFIQVYKVTEDWRDQKEKVNQRTLLQIKGPSQTEKITKALWGWKNETIVTANSDGTVRLYTTERGGQEIQVVKAHNKEIKDLQFDKYHTTFITASPDGYAKLFDTRTLECVKTYHVGRPLNTAAISPLMDHVVFGGGEAAGDVTVSKLTSEQFKVRFWHTIFAEELGTILGHFGPVNCLSFNPDGRSFVSGGEDGFVRVHFMAQDYFSRKDDLSRWDVDEEDTEQIKTKE